MYLNTGMDIKYLIMAEGLIAHEYVTGWTVHDLAKKLSERETNIPEDIHSLHGLVEYSGSVLSTNPKIIPIDDEGRAIPLEHQET